MTLGLVRLLMCFIGLVNVKGEGMREYKLSEINIPVGYFCERSTGELVG